MCWYDLGFPMEEGAIDLMELYPESQKGTKYILVIVDSFFKWMEAYPVPNIDHSGEICHGIYLSLWRPHPDQARQREAI